MKRPEKIEYVIRTGGEGGELRGVWVLGYSESEIDRYIDHLEDKLETIKTWFKENEQYIEPDYADEDAIGRTELRKILEGGEE